MGVLTPSCVTTRNGRMYAFGTTLSYDTSAPIYYIIQSNDNPSYTLEGISWTLISAVPTAGYSEIKSKNHLVSYGYQLSCTIDDKGVFSVLHVDDVDKTQAGLQYQPSPGNGVPSPSSAGIFGVGSWRNITLPTNYRWNEFYFADMFNFKDSQGVNTPMHVTTTNRVIVDVAALDPATMTMKQDFVLLNSFLVGLLLDPQYPFQLGGRILGGLVEVGTQVRFCAVVVMTIAVLGFMFNRRRRLFGRNSNGNNESNGNNTKIHQPQQHHQNSGLPSAETRQLRDVQSAELKQQFSYPASNNAATVFSDNTAVSTGHHNNPSNGWEWKDTRSAPAESYPRPLHNSASSQADHSRPDLPQGFP
ncbi:hypothetical protein BGZ65_012034 [Modicella reniformis]|uniref:Uncharacterized protein n=1 Tax=Modicella reniformis TaxID=1440133 RepID=A0A9P6MK36_9FUNG|nr:hypothetical protein BGZ65_012034 [Modicella reniformis]